MELDDGAGQTKNTYTYDIWGAPVTTQELVAQPFRYSGELWDSTTGLQYLRARWYDPHVGRFMNEDTYEGELEDPLSLNLYTYVKNNPLRYWDPTGHKLDEGYGGGGGGGSMKVTKLSSTTVSGTGKAPKVNIGSQKAFELPERLLIRSQSSQGNGNSSPNLSELHMKLDDLAEMHLLPQFREIDPNLKAGYTGSFKTGTVGNPNKATFGEPFNLNKYDIDYFIESDTLFAKYGNSLKANPEFRKILSESAGFEGLKPNKEGFSIKFKPSSK